MFHPTTNVCALSQTATLSPWHDWNRRLGNLPYLELSSRSWHCPKQSRNSSYTNVIFLLVPKTTFDGSATLTLQVTHSPPNASVDELTSANFRELSAPNTSEFGWFFFFFFVIEWLGLPQLCVVSRINQSISSFIDCEQGGPQVWPLSGPSKSHSAQLKPLLWALFSYKFIICCALWVLPNFFSSEAHGRIFFKHLLKIQIGRYTSFLNTNPLGSLLLDNFFSYWKCTHFTCSSISVRNAIVQSGK